MAERHQCQTAIDEIGGQPAARLTTGIMGPSSTDIPPSAPAQPKPVRKTSEGCALNTLNPTYCPLRVDLKAVGEDTKEPIANLARSSIWDFPRLNALQSATLQSNRPRRGLPTPTAEFGPWTLKGEP